MSTICLYGSASGGIDPAHVDLAATVGRRIGERGHDLVYGGGGTSVMGARRPPPGPPVPARPASCRRP